MKKKFFCIMLAAAMTASAITFVSAQQDWISCDLDGVAVDYSTYTGSVRKTGKSASGSSDTAPSATVKLYSLTIPSDIEGTEIVAVAEGGFYDEDGLETLKLPDTLKTIGAKSFAGSDNLKSVSIPNAVTQMGNEAFASCDALAKVTIGSSLSTISQYCFKGCKALTSITIPSNVKTIENSAFEGCKAMTSITFKGDMDSIGNGAFKNCALTSVTLPEGITIINSNLFESCSDLESVEIPAGVKTIDQSAFKDCKNLKKIYIPDSCKSIASSAFSGCTNVVIYCSKNSFASTFADNQGIKYETSGFKTSDSSSSTTETAADTSKIKVVVNGELLDCGAADPVVINGRTLVPLRPIFEALGVDLSWNGNTKTITGTKGTQTIKLVVGNTQATLNGKVLEMDVPPQIIDGNTMVPLRFIGECLGCTIDWSEQRKTATISQ